MPSPTMHHAILMEAEIRPTPLPISSIRFIPDDAGGTVAYAREKVEGYIQPSIDPHQLRDHPMVRVYKVL
jgi:hypothetical protein